MIHNELERIQSAEETILSQLTAKEKKQHLTKNQRSSALLQIAHFPMYRILSCSHIKQQIRGR